MSAHRFNISGGEFLADIGATWFVSYAYYEKIDQTHQNWSKVSTVNLRVAKYKKSSQYHKAWLRHILDMNPKKLNKNTIGVTASQTISMALELLAHLAQQSSQSCQIAHSEEPNTQLSSSSVLLCDIAQILRPLPTHANVSAPIALPENWKYPVNYDKLSISHQTDCFLQKGDIVLFNHERILIVYEQPPVKIYASINCFVLRPTCSDFCSEYLYYYLTSETVRTLLRSLETEDLTGIHLDELKNLPITYQENTHEFYQSKFFEENFPYGHLQKHYPDITTNHHICKPYSGDKQYIFISYAHKDISAVMPTIQYLLENGYRVWYDEGIDPGTEWDKNIAEHIIDCGFFIAFMSNNYLNSSNCKDELNFARNLDKSRFLVYTEKVELPPEMQMRLSRIQNIHKYTYPNDESFFLKLETAKNLKLYKD